MQDRQGSHAAASTQGASRLHDTWRLRAEQLRQLEALLGPSGGAAPSVLISGRTGTGKTALVRDFLISKSVISAWCNCVESQKPQYILQILLAQLKDRKRKAGDVHQEHQKQCSAADFLWQLTGLAPADGGLKVLVLDNAHRIADQPLLAVLLRLRELTGANVAVVLLSQQAWGSGAFLRDTCACPRPQEIFMPAYEDQQLLQILTSRPAPVPEGVVEDAQAVAAARLHFLRLAVMPHTRTSRRLEDLQELAHQLWPRYLQPVLDGTVAITEHSKLMRGLGPHLKALEDGPASASTSAASTPALDLELPYCAKWLLLAAFLASRNSHATDRRLFDLTAKSRQRGGLQAHRKHVAKAGATASKGPRSFVLERLLSVFWGLLRAEADTQLAPAAATSADVFCQISSLVSLRLLSQVGDNVLEDIKYVCNITEVLARRIAKNVQPDMQLNDYLLYH